MVEVLVPPSAMQRCDIIVGFKVQQSSFDAQTVEDAECYFSINQSGSFAWQEHSVIVMVTYWTGSSWRFGALLKSITVVVIRDEKVLLLIQT